MYRIYVKHKGENFYSLVVNGSYMKFVKWIRKNHHRFRPNEPAWEDRTKTRWYEEE